MHNYTARILPKATSVTPVVEYWLQGKTIKKNDNLYTKNEMIFF